MHSTITRLVAGGALMGALVLTSGAPALAARPLNPTPAPATPTVRHTPPVHKTGIGTAVQWVRGPNGAPVEVTLH